MLLFVRAYLHSICEIKKKTKSFYLVLLFIDFFSDGKRPLILLSTVCMVVINRIRIQQIFLLVLKNSQFKFDIALDLVIEIEIEMYVIGSVLVSLFIILIVYVAIKTRWIYTLLYKVIMKT